MAGEPAKFEVVLTEGAEQDLEAIHDYICEFDSEANANRVLDAVMDVVDESGTIDIAHIDPWMRSFAVAPE